MKCTALLILAALTRALVCAQDNSSSSEEVPVPEDPAASEPSKPILSLRNPEEHPPVGEVYPIVPKAEEFLKAWFSLPGAVYQGVENKLNEGVNHGKKAIENAFDYLQALKNKIIPGLFKQ